jgi:formylglycine-generating enzyme required for sulfatase activity
MRACEPSIVRSPLGTGTMKLQRLPTFPSWYHLLQRAVAVGVMQCALFSGLNLQAIGDDNTNRISLQGESLSSDAFRFFFQADANQTYPIAVSFDLRNWSLLTNVTGGGGPLWITNQDAAQFQQRFYHIGIPPTPVANMVFIPAGAFTMGSPDSEVGRDSKEGPQTEVTLSRGFWIGKFEVTQREYIAVTGSNYSAIIYDTRLPLDSQSWPRATNYCYMLTAQERAAGRLPMRYRYRLPTEAEWEYACRAGTTTPFGVGNGISLSSTEANFDGTFPYGGAAPGRYLFGTTLGGTYAPNAWGLYDMHGNVWEWCQDWYGPYPGGKVTDPKGPLDGATHVLRGGGFTSTGSGCRSSKRDSRSPMYVHTIQGFRVVLAAD